MLVRIASTRTRKEDADGRLRSGPRAEVKRLSYPVDAHLTTLIWGNEVDNLWSKSQ